MLNKRIKSVLVAGLLILGISRQSFADTIISDKMIINNTGLAPGTEQYIINQDSIKVVVYDISNTTGYPVNTYDIQCTWNKDEVKVTKAGAIFTGAIDEISNSKEIDIDEEQGKARLIITLPNGVSVQSVDVTYDLINNSGNTGQEQQLTVEEQIIKNYINKMNSTNVGVRDESTNTRTIGKEYGISQKDWEEFITQLEDEGQFDVETHGQPDGSYIYTIYSRISGGATDGTIVEIIKIEFFDSKGAKDWIPEITPGTGQALAVGGIVIGAAAAVGLLVNNRKRKDEE